MWQCLNCWFNTIPSNGNAGIYEFMLLSKDAKEPMQGTPGSAALDVFSPREYSIPPSQTIKIPIEIAIKPPDGTYARTVSRSGLAVREQLFIPADCIDPDYRGGIHICLTNLSTTEYKVSKHERIGSIIFEQYVVPRGKEVKSMDSTVRGFSGFGSTGKM